MATNRRDATTHAAAIMVFLERDRVVEEWTRRVRADARIPSALHVVGAAFANYVPRLVEALSEALRCDPDASDVRGRALAFGRAHLVDRRDAGFTLTEVTAELGHLHAVLLGYLEHSPSARAFLDDARDAAQLSATQLYVASMHPRGRMAASLDDAVSPTR